MSYFEIILISISLAIDCFAVSFSAGGTQKSLTFKNMFVLAFCFGFFQAMMPVIGWFGGSAVLDLMSNFDHWIAFTILAAIGGKMLFDGIKNEEEKVTDVTKIATIIILSIATSIDALAVGFSFSMLPDVNIWIAIAFIGAASLLLSLFGFYAGRNFGKLVKPRYATILGGVVLISIGTKILIEHLIA